MFKPTLAHIAALLVPFVASAQQECPRPAVRTTNALVTAISQDEVMAAAFERAATACAVEGPACDEERVACGKQLTVTLQQQLNFDEGAYHRDMLVTYAGQQYRMSIPIAAPAALNDVSCGGDVTTLKAAAGRRKQQAERRRVVTQEYPKWVLWVNNQFKACQDRLNVDKARADQQAAEAAKLLAAAEAAKQAELIKQDQKAAAERAAREKAEAEAKQREDAKKAQEAAAAEAAKQKAAQEQAARDAAEAQKRAAEEKAEAERRAKETEAERIAREQKEAADAKLVAEREARKAAGEAKRKELDEREAAREADLKAKREASRAAAEAAHQRKVEELQKAVEMSEADKAARMAELDKEFEASEAARKEQLEKERAGLGEVDRSDERLGGAISAHASAGYLGLGTAGLVLGGQVTLRHGFWGTAPASGLASGVELRGTALFLVSLDAKNYLIQLSPEIRYWFGFFGLGAAFDYQLIQITTGTVGVSTSTIGLGPTISIAAVDSPDARVFFTVRWTPFLNEQYERVTGEIEGGYGIFSFAVQGGVLKQAKTTTMPAPPLGFFVGGSLGARLRW